MLDLVVGVEDGENNTHLGITECLTGIRRLLNFPPRDKNVPPSSNLDGFKEVDKNKPFYTGTHFFFLTVGLLSTIAVLEVRLS